MHSTASELFFNNCTKLLEYYRTFLPALTAHDLKSPDVHEAIAKCFLDNVSEDNNFINYVEH